MFYYSPPADGMLPWPGKHPGHGRRRLLPKGGLSVYALCVLVCGAILYICFMAHHLARAEGGVGADAGMPSMLRRRLHNAAVRLSLRYEGLTQALGASHPTSAPETRKQQRKHARRRADGSSNDGSSNDRRAGSAAPFAEVIPRAAQEGVSLPICPICQSALAICITFVPYVRAHLPYVSPVSLLALQRRWMPRRARRLSTGQTRPNLAPQQMLQPPQLAT